MAVVAVSVAEAVDSVEAEVAASVEAGADTEAVEDAADKNGKVRRPSKGAVFFLVEGQRQ